MPRLLGRLTRRDVHCDRGCDVNRDRARRGGRRGRFGGGYRRGRKIEGSSRSALHSTDGRRFGGAGGAVLSLARRVAVLLRADGEDLRLAAELVDVPAHLEALLLAERQQAEI